MPCTSVARGRVSVEVIARPQSRSFVSSRLDTTWIIAASARARHFLVSYGAIEGSATVQRPYSVCIESRDSRSLRLPASSTPPGSFTRARRPYSILFSTLPALSPPFSISPRDSCHTQSFSARAHRLCHTPPVTRAPAASLPSTPPKPKPALVVRSLLLHDSRIRQGLPDDAATSLFVYPPPSPNHAISTPPPLILHTAVAMSDEKVRASLDAARDPAQPVLPTVNPNLKRSEPKDASFHPAVYISTWIALSSSVIIFNKYILDTAKFRKLHLPMPSVQLLTIRQTFPSSSQHGISSSLPS